MIIYCPKNFAEERRYILSWVFGEVFGLDYDLRPSKNREWRLEQDGAGCVILSDAFFEGCATKGWLGEHTLPSDSFPMAVEIPGSCDDRSLPVLFGDVGNGEWLRQDGDQATCKIDLLGGLFFLLSRYEECVCTERDEHDRFPASASVLGKAGLLGQAVGNEYIEVLWAMMQRVWPGLERKRREFRMIPSHDIDSPSSAWRQWRRVALRFSSQLKKGRVGNAISTVSQRLRYEREADWAGDPFDTLDWIMDCSEEHGVQSSFYYIPFQTDQARDLGMPLHHPHILDQWRRIADRKHLLGMHPGYGTFDDSQKIQKGADLVRAQMKKLGIEQECLGGRQHFLRWKTPQTGRYWSIAGLDYDSTLGFADQIGFRCGVCYEFPLYDLVERKQLSLRERPLVAMDCTVIDSRYMGMGAGERAFDAFKNLKDECRKFNGDFTLLWHNQRFVDHDEKSLYQSVLEA